MKSALASEWPTPTAQRWVERSLGHVKVARSQRLVGGLTADMFRLTLAGRATAADEVVLRCWPVEAEWASPSVTREAAGLAALAGSGLPVPRLLASDPTGGEAGSPSTLTTVVPGLVDLTPADLDDRLHQMASMLVRIHALPVADVMPCDEDEEDDEPDLAWLGDARLAAQACDMAAARLDVRQSVLCHGDYQHFNILWRDGRLSGVVDWPKVGMGVRGLDVGHCRLNLAILYSAEAAERFLQRYEAESGCPVDPVPDVRALLGFGPSWLRFIPKQVAGRATVDPAGMANRVKTLVALAVDR